MTSSGVCFLAASVLSSDIGVHGLPLFFRHPFLVLFDIALDHRHPVSGGGCQIPGDNFELYQGIGKGRGHKQKTGHGLQAVLSRLPGRIFAPGDKRNQQAVDHDNQEGDAVMAGQITGLDEQRGVELGVAQVLPGKTGEKQAADKIKGHPEQGRAPDRCHGLHAPAAGRAEKGEIEAHVGAEQQQGQAAQPPGQMAVCAERDDHPVDEQQVIEQPADKAEQGGLFRSDSGAAGKQRHQGEPGAEGQPRTWGGQPEQQGAEQKEQVNGHGILGQGP